MTAGVGVATFVRGAPISPSGSEAGEFSLCPCEGRVWNTTTKGAQKNNKVGAVKKPKQSNMNKKWYLQALCDKNNVS